MPKNFVKLSVLTLAMIVFGFVVAGNEPDPVKITEDSYRENLITLASDKFEGRAPATRGEELTIAFLEEKLKSYGVEPGNNGSYFQKVPMVAFEADPSSTLTYSHNNKATELRYGDDFIAYTRRLTNLQEVTDSEVVFAGYGVVAPEYGWDDYKDLDVRGKTVIVLVNDPGLVNNDDNLFTGKDMTYYGRYFYKFEEASRQGAAALLVVHETIEATYPWAPVRNSFFGLQRGLVSDDNNQSRVGVEGWITVDAARKIFVASGHDFEDLKSQAKHKDFQPVSMNLNISIAIPNTYSFVVSNNVIGIVRGSKRPGEYVLYTAHWDHLGVRMDVDGDNIYNGAADNATGTAGLLELAKAFSALEAKPERSVIFLSVTGEEYGLLGSAYYATHPVYPLNRTAGAINMDGLNNLGPTNDISVIGFGRSELDDYVEAAAQQQNRLITKDPYSEFGIYYRSDHFSVAKQGLPSIFITTGLDHRENGAEWMEKEDLKYIANHYHTPEDEYSPDWDLTGAIEDLNFIFAVGHRMAQSSSFPNWRDGDEFKSIRDQDMKNK